MASDIQAATPLPSRSTSTAVAATSFGSGEEAPQSTGIGYLLSLRNFRNFWFSNLFHGIATWIQSTSLNWVVFDTTGSGFILGIIGLGRTLPMLFLSPLAGVLADRLDRQRYMVAINALHFLTAAGLALGLLLGRVGTGHLLAFAFIVSVYHTAIIPLQNTLVFDLVPRRIAPQAVGLNSAAMNLTQVAGPSLAGFLISALGPEGNFFTQAAMYVGVVISLLMISFPPRGAGTARVLRQSMWSNLKEGVRYASKEKTVRLLILLGVFQSIFLAPMLFTMMPVLAKDVFHVKATGLGYMVSAFGAGGVIGAFFVASLKKVERRGVLQLCALGLSGAGFLSLSFAPNLYAGLPFLAVAGFCMLVFGTASQTILQLIVPQEMRGRVMGLSTITVGLFPIGGLVMGAMSDVVGGRMVEHVSGSVIIGVALLFLLFSARMRGIRLNALTANSPQAA